VDEFTTHDPAQDVIIGWSIFRRGTLFQMTDRATGKRQAEEPRQTVCNGVQRNAHLEYLIKDIRKKTRTVLGLLHVILPWPFALPTDESLEDESNYPPLDTRIGELQIIHCLAQGTPLVDQRRFTVRTPVRPTIFNTHYFAWVKAPFTALAAVQH
jgi:hypothetical protein